MHGLGIIQRMNAAAAQDATFKDAGDFVESTAPSPGTPGYTAEDAQQIIRKIIKALTTPAGKLKDFRKIGHNTYAYRTANGYGITYHQTQIFHITDEGVITIDSGGWHTSTTKTRMNEWLPRAVGIFQKAHVWYIWQRETDEKFAYVDGEIIRPEVS